MEIPRKDKPIKPFLLTQATKHVSFFCAQNSSEASLLGKEMI
jgi:hypothetical protein